MSNPLELLAGDVRVIDLAQAYFPGMPHFPTHPPFIFGLVKQHGEMVLANGASSSSDAIALGAHVGTHIDALSHFSCDGRWFGEIPVEQSQSEGMGRYAIDGVAPILRRGVLFDIAGRLGAAALPADFTITPEDLEACDVDCRSGDVALIRTGWGRYFTDAKQFITGGVNAGVNGPGVVLAGAQWLSARGIFAAGADTVAFERTPSKDMEVHVHLLVEKGIHIIECLNLEELAESGAREFLFAAAPLKIRGATGAPIRPFAVV
ncbi:MAG: cyclase family protein, partial [Bryobacteraceae bacterium]